MDEETTIERRWYWDRRINKALRPVESDGDADMVELRTIWHREELEDAIEADALTPVEDIKSGGEMDSFEFIGSFRTPEVDDES